MKKRASGDTPRPGRGTQSPCTPCWLMPHEQESIITSIAQPYKSRPGRGTQSPCTPCWLMPHEQESIITSIAQPYKSRPGKGTQSPSFRYRFFGKGGKKERQDAAICYDEQIKGSSKAGERICLARIDYRSGRKRCQPPLPS